MTNPLDAATPSGPKFKVGDDLFVREPNRFIADCTCIVGPVTEVVPFDGGTAYRIAASVGRVGGGYDREFTAQEQDFGLRLGTPLSQLSGRPGHPGYDEFKRIAASWGYD